MEGWQSRGLGPICTGSANFGPGNGLDRSAIEFGHAAVHLGRPRGFGVLVHLCVKTLQHNPASAARASVGSARASFRISAGSRFMV